MNKIKGTLKFIVIVACLVAVFSVNLDSWISVIAMALSGVYLTYAAWSYGWLDEDEEEEGDC